MSESLFSNAPSLQACEHCEIFKNKCFEKHLRIFSSENICDHSQNTTTSKENVEVDENRNRDNDDELKPDAGNSIIL